VLFSAALSVVSLVLEALLRDQYAGPLASMAEALIVRSRAHGAVLHDQTVLLLRRVA